jgi:hypothetical protein
MAKKGRPCYYENKFYMLYYKFGVDEDMYNEMMEEQGGCCAICGRGDTTKTDRWDGTASLQVDHCHQTGLVRGLLCSNCNQAAGLLQDNPDLARKLAWYLDPID